MTTKDEHTDLFYPQLMNKGLNDLISTSRNFVTLLPLACWYFSNCTDACFIQQSFFVSHSRKSNDESKVCYRLICYQNFRESYFHETSSLKDFAHIILPKKYRQNDLLSLCPKSRNGNNLIDSYNLNF